MMEQYLCKWLVDERDARLYELASRYHRSCEEFDRKICTGPVRYGEIYPATREEFRLINQHALQVRKAILGEAVNEGFYPAEILKAIQQVGRTGVLGNP